MYPAKQLFLFSNQFCEEAANWFSGGLIQEIDIEEDEIRNFDELLLLINILGMLGHSYKKVTIVTSYNVNGLTFATLAGAYDFVCKINGRDDFDDLVKIHNIFMNCIATNYDLEKAYDLAKSMNRKMTGPDYKSARNVHKELKVNLNKSVVHSQLLINSLTDIFSRKFQSGF